MLVFAVSFGYPDAAGVFPAAVSAAVSAAGLATPGGTAVNHETSSPDRELFYPVWVSKTGRISLRWGRPCDTPSEARRLGKNEVDAGRASLAFVVCFQGGTKTPMPHFVYPASALKVVQHWESLWDATE